MFAIKHDSPGRLRFARPAGWLLAVGLGMVLSTAIVFAQAGGGAGGAAGGAGGSGASATAPAGSPATPAGVPAPNPTVPTPSATAPAPDPTAPAPSPTFREPALDGRGPVTGALPRPATIPPTISPPGSAPLPSGPILPTAPIPRPAAPLPQGNLASPLAPSRAFVPDPRFSAPGTAPSGIGGSTTGGAAAGTVRNTAGGFSPLQLSRPVQLMFGQNSNLGLAFDGRQNGLVISNLNAHSPAATAGLQTGDRILAINRSWVNTPDRLRERLSAALQQDGRAWVYVIRGGQRQWVNLDLSGTSQGKLGIDIIDERGAVTISNVLPGSVARRVGLQRGDTVVSVNGVAISSNADLIGKIRNACNARIEMSP